MAKAKIINAAELRRVLDYTANDADGAAKAA